MQRFVISLVKPLVKGVLKVVYRVEVTGLEHYYTAQQSQQPLLLIANHVSLLDGPLLDLFIPGKTTFMIDESHTKKWYERVILSMTDFFKVNLHSPYAAKHMIETLREGKQCMIFPEGRITTTGGLMKIYDGTALVAQKTQAAVLPIYIGGAVYSRFSYLDGTKFGFMKRLWFPKITLNIQPAQTLNAPLALKGHAKHLYLKQQITRLMRNSIFYGSVRSVPLYKALVQAKQTFHANQVSVEDVKNQALSLKKINQAAIILGKQLDVILAATLAATPENASPGLVKRVGLMLPNVAAMPVSFFALQAYGYVPAMINFTAGAPAIESACATAQLDTIITSQAFVEAFGLHDLVANLAPNVRFIYLEEVRQKIGVAQKIAGLLTPVKRLPGYHVNPHDEAVVLFTSGSEGVPKGVVLSHHNVVSNIEQISAMLTLLPGEQLLNALPTFHCFGLTAGMLWPILKGAKVFLYPSPVHYAVVPEMSYQTNAKLIFGTDTFFTGYARKADPYDFYSLRAMVSGAERLRPETRELFASRFHQAIFEGYGVTETTPVLSVNIPTAFKHGSVGQFVPGIDYRLEPVAGIKEGGQLWVKGPNVMLGYLLSPQPGLLQPPVDGWHDTGDIVHVDDDGYVWIKGRAKRFAKIGGEMVSLTAVESYINQASPEGHHVVVAVPDERKGEQLVLVTDDISLSRQTVLEAAKDKKVSELMVPKKVILVETVPLLGSGKTNYPAVQKIAEQHFTAGS